MAPARVEAPIGPSRARSASRRRRRVLGLLACLVGLVVVVVLSVSIGSREVSLAEVVSAFTDPTATGLAEEAVRARVPRTVLGLLVGAALGLAGAIMQGVTRNPLADPGILGVNTGASLFVVAGIAFFGMTTFTDYIWLALAGAAASAVFVYTVGSLGRGGATPLKLALAGAATTAALSSLISAIVLPRVDALQVFRFWQIGGIGGADWDSMVMVVPFLAVGALLSLLSARSLDALALGDELATGLGGNVAAARAVAALGGVLLCGAATAIAGPIGFIGLVVPHVARMLTGSHYRWILPYSVGFGALLLLLADVVGRVVTRPSDVEVGIITAIIGAPVFIAVVRRQKIKEL
nr:iron ABC transporter permease [Labedella populi]